MLIKNLFERDIFRPINGVVKADQLDDTSVWQELDEFVITKELDKHFSNFISWYLQAVEQGTNPDPTGKMGIWISGYFGSGKSHFLKVLSYLLRNRTHQNGKQSRQAVEFFESKVKDTMLFADIKRAVAANTDVILFNIDSKADHRTGRDLILRVFLKVLNELQGYSGDHPHIAHMERHLESKGKLEAFKVAFRKLNGNDWVTERDAYEFSQDEVVKALSETLGQSEAASVRWIEGAEQNFPLTVENFCKWVNDYLDSKGPTHRIVFLVDEVGQFIGTDSHLMLNLQTITEELGTICRRRAWVVVTSQEDMDAVLGDMSKTKKQDFSKIQGRFFPPLSLSSANVDEVIQSRLLAKLPDVKAEIEDVFKKRGDILKSQLTFKNCGMNFRQFKDGEDFVKNYPFAPYQFQLIQKVFESIRKAGATGMHLARGERSMLDAFQSAAKTVSVHEVGILVPLYDFYPSIESFLDTAVKKTIDQARTNSSLEPFDIKLLQVLFLIRYVDEMKGNVDNLVTLCLDQIDGDRLALRRRIEESLGRLEKETLICRSGENYFFLTNEERDINKEIKQVDLSNGEEAKLQGEIIFEDVLKGQRKYRFSANKMDFEFNRRCDQFPVGNQKEGALLVSVITPLADDYEIYDKGKAILESSTEGGYVLIRLGNEESLGRELRTYLQTEKYLSRKNDGTLSESTRRILRDCAEHNRKRRTRLTTLLGDMLTAAEYFVAGQPLKLKAATSWAALDEALEYLIQNTFNKMSFLKRLTPESERLKEIQTVIRCNDAAKETLLFQAGENNPLALDDLRNYLQLCAMKSQQVVLHDMLEKRYALRPYGWPDEEVLLLVARLLVLSEINLVMDSTVLPIEKVYEAITTPAKRRKIIVRKRETSDPKAIQNARSLGKDLFTEMGPDGEDGLTTFLQTKLKGWQTALHGYKQLADTGNYPGGDEITQGLSLTNPLIADKDSKKFIERFNSLKKDLLDLADQFHDLEHFYEHQKPTWEKLRKAHTAFQLNRLELEKDAQAGPALKRMQEILSAKSPYGLVKEADALIVSVNAVNSTLLAGRRKQAIAKIDAQIATLTKDMASAQGEASLRSACLKPLETLREQVQKEESLAHITQAESEAVKEFDVAVGRIEDYLRKLAEQKKPKDDGPGKVTPPAVKKQRVVKPADLVKTTYLETSDDVNGFLDALRMELEQSIAKNERIQIR